MQEGDWFLFQILPTLQESEIGAKGESIEYWVWLLDITNRNAGGSLYYIGKSNGV